LAADPAIIDKTGQAFDIAVLAKEYGFTDLDGAIRFYARVRELLPEDGVALDIGCGRGTQDDDPVRIRRDLRILRGHCRRVIGIDVDPVAAENRFIDEYRPIEPGRPWPVEDASIDLALADFVLEHIEDPDAFFAEAARVIKPGGFFAIRTINVNSYLGLASRLVPSGLHAKTLRRAQPGRQAQDVFPTVYRVNTRKRLARAMQEHTLIGLGQVERITDLVRGPSQDVPETDHLGLHRRQHRDRSADHVERLGSLGPLFGHPAPIERQGRPPAGVRIPGCPERARVERRQVEVVPGEGREGHAAVLPLAPCLGRVDQDPEDPGAQGRTALEPIETLDDPEPRLLHDLVGDRVARDVHPGYPAHRRAQLVHEHHERGLVTRPESLDEGEIIGGLPRFGHDAAA